MIRLSKEIWYYLLNDNIDCHLEKKHSSEWLLHRKVFQAVSQLLGSPTTDPFASRLFNQLPQYIAWHPDPYSQGTDAMIQNWNIGLPYAFSPFIMVSRVLLKIK